MGREANKGVIKADSRQEALAGREHGQAAAQHQPREEEGGSHHLCKGGNQSPDSQRNAASERADLQLSEVKKLEIRAMLTDQTIEEMEGQLYDAHNMSTTTSQKAEDMTKKLQVRTKELGKAQDRAEQASQKLESVNENLRKADIKMAGLQFNLEDRSRTEGKYKKHIQTIQAKINNADQRFARDEESLLKLKARMEMIGVRRNAREEEKKSKKK